nr:hypothetical protein [Mycoplasmopsis bovis]
MLDYYYGLKSESNDSYKGFIQKNIKSNYTLLIVILIIYQLRKIVNDLDDLHSAYIIGMAITLKVSGSLLKRPIPLNKTSFRQS